MIRRTTGNLLEANVESLVNAVNTVGVMGKGIALMFKEAFPENYRAYAQACRHEEVQVGSVFVTETPPLSAGPRWIVNFPTKQHWRHNTQLSWIQDGLDDLRRWIVDSGVESIAVPPLGCGHGGLRWDAVGPLIEEKLGDIEGVEVILFEPTARYMAHSKKSGVEKLTPAHALIAELVRRYWVLGMECSLLEIQKLAWLLDRQFAAEGLESPLKLEFQAHQYGPYADRLRHLLNALDGSYLHSKVRLPDAKPLHVIHFQASRREEVADFLESRAAEYLPALERTTAVIEGFESPFGMELLATIDWLVERDDRQLELDDIKAGLASWSAGQGAAQRKQRIFGDRNLQVGIERLRSMAV